MTKVVHFRQLRAWETSHQLVLRVYQMTRDFPRSELYGLVSQMRRAAVSVPANIAEGFKRRGLLEKIRFYNIAEASLEELKYYFILVKDLDYVSENQVALGDAAEVGRLLHGLIASTERRH